MKSIILNVSFCILLVACSATDQTNNEIKTSLPNDSYFSLAVTDNGHNHVGSHLLFLDFVESEKEQASANNSVYSVPVAGRVIDIDGDASDWGNQQLTQVQGLPQNNFPLNYFVDGVAQTINIGSAWDEDYVYFIVQWHDAGQTQSDEYKRWVYDQTQEQWLHKTHLASSSAQSPNTSAVNFSLNRSTIEDEDRVFFMFPVVDSENNFAAGRQGCGAYCHVNIVQSDAKLFFIAEDVAGMHTNMNGDMADVWQWQAARSNPSGYAQDALLKFENSNTHVILADRGESSYTENTLTDNHPTYIQNGYALNAQSTHVSSDEIAAYTGSANGGDEVPFIIHRQPSESQADVIAKGQYNTQSHQWTVEFRRARNTPYDDDHQFDSGQLAQQPSTENISVVNVDNGKNLFEAHCQICHQQNASGSLDPTGDAWAFPPVQRVSGSQIMGALNSVSLMSGIESKLGGSAVEIRQSVEDIAAYLQTQVSISATSSLSVNVVGADGVNALITSIPAGISCPQACEQEFIQASTIELTANNTSGYLFSHWDGDCAHAGNSQSCELSLDSNKQASAHYDVVIENYNLMVSTAGNGVVSDISQSNLINCGALCQATLAANSVIRLQAQADLGFQFVQWNGDVCDGQTNAICEFELSSDSSVSALFAEIIVASCENKGLIYDLNGNNGFARQMMVAEDHVNSPTDMAFIPGRNGDFLVTEQSGHIKYFRNNSCVSSNTIDLRNENNGGIGVVSGGEQGLLNIEFHPDYSENHLIFLYHTRISNTTQKINSVSRMTLTFNQNNEMVLSDAQKIIDFVKLSTAENHNGGGMVFASDKSLLASVGDGGGGSAINAEIDTNLLGKVSRILPNLNVAQGGYEIPQGNKHAATNAKCSDVVPSQNPCPEIFVNGLRNPYRMSIDGDRVYIGDVGGEFEEINSFTLSEAGLHFGWPRDNGLNRLPEWTDPILTYTRNDTLAIAYRTDDPVCQALNCRPVFASIIIGDVYRGSRYEGLLSGRLMHAEFMDGFMRGISVNSQGQTSDEGRHIIHHDGISAMIQGPDEYIYVVTQIALSYASVANMVYRLVYNPK
ncbi:MAG: PQQ-dependent sugar dehydrogenase [Gammaproteobacteria bacterium]|nr:PQQ-dependent sugar dehydrogenase [Gammaproteobacteria bacterium]